MNLKKRIIISIIFFATSLTLIFTFLKPSIIQISLLTIVALCTILILKYEKKNNSK